MNKEQHNSVIAPENAEAALMLLIETMRLRSAEEGERGSAATALGIAGGAAALDGLTKFLRTHDKAPPAVRIAATLAVGHLLANAHVSD
ncbi:hypothetical protein LZ023_40655 (plasmid) [Pseudomonas silvicola]|nr:hypothetical protein LZ023_40930 [Pseudomonas silvicola]WAH62246.1 hypothetical protein LZ023_40655 [Pseudomonas silvicola]